MGGPLPGRPRPRGDRRRPQLRPDVRHAHPDTAELRASAARIAVRRGRRIAAVALARRLAGILYAMWRDGTDSRPERVTPQAQETALAS